MAGSVRLVLTFHNHQPVGNFDGVFEQAYRDSYLPFLDVMQDYPEIPFGLHTSGSLLEWLEPNHPEYINRLRRMVGSSQVEIIGGAFYEPILANIPRRDRIGQIQTYTQHLNQLFNTNVRGMWLPERVWEQSFASDIAAAGIQYTIIDDYHFRCAGIPQNELAGYYVTEDEGRLLLFFRTAKSCVTSFLFQSPSLHCGMTRPKRSNGKRMICEDERLSWNLSTATMRPRMPGLRWGDSRTID